ncbi:PadR family transcriptional regulator [Corynebacterium lactis]|uniref:ParR family transcriptional regulator n=1 Tax=Corynebacterium lactis RW2-5 TaxID=1408189 RepID=A0A0K2GYX4_9CORY|nr:PadR family transcriptional regulator [Corynebacterium lactis]ALA66985.1 ParR family transcriptional regulator [Corynebacterium lactis RW2-5]
MSIKHSLLTLLGEAPLSASELRAAFEEEMGGLYSLNQGQVSQTLSRLTRDGLVVSHESTSQSGRTVEQYEITNAGVTELRAWWAEAVEQPESTRDELVIRFALAAWRDPQNFIVLMDTQRFATLRKLRVLSAEASSMPEARTAARLNVERRIFELESILRWLDRIESLAPPTKLTSDMQVSGTPVSTSPTDAQEKTND